MEQRKGDKPISVQLDPVRQRIHLSDEKYVDFSGMGEAFQMEEKIRMHVDDGDFDKEPFLYGMIRSVIKQRLMATAEILKKIVGYIDTTQFVHRCDQLGVEIVYVICQSSAIEMWKIVEKKENGEIEKISELYERPIAGAMRELTEMQKTKKTFVMIGAKDERKIWFEKCMEHPQVKVKIRDVLVDLGIDGTESEIDTIIGSIRIYTYPSFCNLLGVNVRDGFVIFPNALVGIGTKSNTYKAQLAVLFIHQVMHHVVRRLMKSFAWKTPTSKTKGNQSTPRFEQVQECGRMLELAMFNGETIDWESSSAEGTEEFVRCIENKTPFYTDQDEWKNSGLIGEGTSPRLFRFNGVVMKIRRVKML